MCSKVANTSLSTPKPVCGLSETVLPSKHWLVTIRQGILRVCTSAEETKDAFLLTECIIELFPASGLALEFFLI